MINLDADNKYFPSGIAMTTYTTELKQKLRDDIRFIDDQLDAARRHMANGNKAEAWSILDGLLEYYDFKNHFPDIFINENESMRFMYVRGAARDRRYYRDRCGRCADRQAAGMAPRL